MLQTIQGGSQETRSLSFEGGTQESTNRTIECGIQEHGFGRQNSATLSRSYSACKQAAYLASWFLGFPLQNLISGFLAAGFKKRFPFTHSRCHLSPSP
jgi:hypothetical protein